MIVFYLNIGSVSMPVSGGGYVDVSEYVSYPDTYFNNEIEDDEYFTRPIFEGNVTFFGALKTACVSLISSGTYSVGVKIYEDLTELWNGNAFLRGRIDNIINSMSVIFQSSDAYINILANTDKVFNVVDVNPREEIDVDREIFDIEVVEISGPAGSPFGVQQTATIISYLGNVAATLLDAGKAPRILSDGYSGVGWKVFREDYSFISLNFWGNELEYNHVSTVLHREVKLTEDIAGQKNDPGGTWIDIDVAVVIAGKNYHKFVRVPYSGYTTYNWTEEGSISSYNTLDITGYQQLLTYVTYSRGRLLKDVIKYIVTNIDAAILFEDEDTPASTDSFYYMKTFEETAINPNTGEEQSYYTLKYLSIGSITDAILAEDGYEKDTPASIYEISFSDLMRFMKERFKIYWKLESRSGVWYFITKHRSELTWGSGSNPDLSNYLSANWIQNKDTYEYDDSRKFNRLKRETTAADANHRGFDVTIPVLDSLVNKTVSISSQTFYTDIWDIIANGSTKYPTSTTTQFYLISAERILGAQLSSNYAGYTLFGWDYEQAAVGGYGFLVYVTNTTQTCYVNSNDMTGIQGGNVVEISFSITLNSGIMPYFAIYYSGQQQEFFTIASGGNTLTHKLDAALLESDTFYVKWFISPGATTNFTVQNITIKKHKYKCLKATGSATGVATMNAPVSIANCDENHSSYDMPGTPAIINGVSTNLAANQLMKDKRMIEIQLPMYDPTLINMDEEILTDAGAAIPVSFKTSLNYKAASLIAYLK